MMQTLGKILILLTAVIAALPGAGADEVGYFANGENARQLRFGGGEDGSFFDGPVQTGISIAGATITVNTDVKSTFSFRDFTLSAGNTLRAVGSNPLTIQVLGAASIQGTISLVGLAGDNANIGAAGVGGTPGAGGGLGGTGGKEPPAGANGSDGLPRTGPSIGGTTPANEAGLTTQMAGGGGCNGSSAGAGNFATAGYRFPTGAGNCSLSQATIASGFDTTFTGGSGGGGGGTRDLAVNDMNGAGGGAGGGAFHLTSLGSITVSGTINASGGAGGVGDIGGGGDFGSSGGGGAGGSIWLQTADRFLGAGSLVVTGGTGGIDATLTNDGGNGSRGVIRVDALTNQFTGAITPAGLFDASFLVSPITVGFDLKGGLACGTLSRPLTGAETQREVFSLLGWVTLFGVFWLSGRGASRSRS